MNLLLKLFLVGVVAIVLVIPLALLRSLVHERQERAREVAGEIAQSSSRPQTLIGPFGILDIEKTLRTKRAVTESAQTRVVAEDRRAIEHVLLAPHDLKIDGSLKTERRNRGIFSAVLYNAGLQLKGRLAIPSPPALSGELVGYRVTSGRLVLGLGDSRGMQRIGVTLGGRSLSVEQGSTVGWLHEGVHVPLPQDLLHPSFVDFVVDLDLVGTESLGVVPLGGANEVSLRADWPHPGFTGQYLPVSRQIDSSGFRAAWRVSRLASPAQQRLQACGADDTAACQPLFDTAFQARLVDPVDRYLMTDRAMKYSLLTLTLVFGAVFFIEVLKRVRVHPMQYALTGLAVAIFFLLLLSLAEHVGFGIAYLVASLACVALIGFYMIGVLGSFAGGASFAALLAGLYALLYGLLQSEDYALLVGALCLFALLAFVMIMTRRLDWYNVIDRSLQPPDRHPS